MIKTPRMKARIERISDQLLCDTTERHQPRLLGKLLFASSVETLATLLRSKGKNEDQRDDNSEFEKREGPGIAQVISQRIFKGDSGRSNQDAELVNKPGKETAYRIRRQLIEMRGNNAE